MLSISISTLGKSQFISLNFIKDIKQEEKLKPKPPNYTIFGEVDRDIKFTISNQIQIKKAA